MSVITERIQIGKYRVALKITRIFDGTTKGTATTAKSTRYPLFYDSSTIGIRKSASAGIRTNSEEGWEIVNAGAQRVSSNAYIHVLFRSKSDPTSYKTKVTSSSLSAWATKTEEINGELFTPRNAHKHWGFRRKGEE